MSFRFYGPCDDDQADAILTAALDLGLNPADTSNVYGMGVSEQRIGTSLPNRASGRRFLSYYRSRHLP